MYTFLYADFEGVGFYAARWYINLTKNKREKDFFVSDEEEEYDEALPVSELLLLVEQRVCGVEISGLPYLDSGNNFNFTSEYMADIQEQGIAVYNNNDPSPQNFPSPKTPPYHNHKRITVGNRE